jgi:hypothetical protein
MILGMENVAVDLVNIRFGFMLLGSNNKPAVKEFNLYPANVENRVSS